MSIDKHSFANANLPYYRTPSINSSISRSFDSIVSVNSAQFSNRTSSASSSASSDVALHTSPSLPQFISGLTESRHYSHTVDDNTLTPYSLSASNTLSSESSHRAQKRSSTISLSATAASTQPTIAPRPKGLSYLNQKALLIDNAKERQLDQRISSRSGIAGLSLRPNNNLTSTPMFHSASASSVKSVPLTETLSSASTLSLPPSFGPIGSPKTPPKENDDRSISSSDNIDRPENIAPGKAKTNTSLYKTEMCASYSAWGYCLYYEKCQFAHGPEELRPVVRHAKWRTKICAKWQANGSCKYGSRCCFMHPEPSDNRNHGHHLR
ncbi:hypothetical protein CANCADRAFT_109867 [Tortispora caseinolytica NRRL Y-17796]|uniref:C3H1-type domain-containing protein n=1 Tax=Tortispora caseinolytica NRRL Y-17796 TaxID=767744 RepID=A0A1E4TG09_9ASCO|nr:hypothetical protein CANCADRAFT_109867 [Tortispora caseinolytica NRRL Y-17796]